MQKESNAKSATPIGGNKDYDKEHDRVWQIRGCQRQDEDCS